jgi:type II secretory pathway pseudopilin PulG
LADHVARQFDRPSTGNMTTPAQIVRYFDKFLTALEGVTADLQSQITAIAAAQAAADAAQATANTAQSTATTAQTTATTAQSTADTVKRDDSISTSWTSPGTILSATDAGSNATITVSNHTRKYTDVSSKSVTGGTVTGLAYSTTYTIYYDQTSRAGGSVTYHATTDPNVGLANAAAGRHWCGKITTPASGGGGTSGGVDPPGGGGGYVGGEIP